MITYLAVIIFGSRHSCPPPLPPAEEEAQARAAHEATLKAEYETKPLLAQGRTPVVSALASPHA